MDTRKITPRRTRESWQELVQQCEASQMTAKAWCLQHEVSYESFIVWRKRLKDTCQSTTTKSKTAFIELADDPSVNSGIEIHIQNLRLLLGTNFDQATLLRCLQVLEKF